MAFHVEIRRSVQRARAFNLDEQKLRRTVVEPWRRGGPVELGDQQWNPGESALRILEGPALSPPELALGRGWNTAERSGTDVTTRVMRDAAEEAVVVAVLAETPRGLESATRLLNQIGAHTADWAAVRADLLSPTETAQTLVALLLVERANPAGPWLFEAGLAVGALGARAIVAQLGDEPPPAELRDLGVIRLEALAERLQAVV